MADRKLAVHIAEKWMKSEDAEKRKRGYLRYYAYMMNKRQDFANMQKGQLGARARGKLLPRYVLYVDVSIERLDIIIGKLDEWLQKTKMNMLEMGITEAEIQQALL
jgi:hypothetical protein